MHAMLLLFLPKKKKFEGCHRASGKEWLKRLRCDHSEAVWAGSKPGACDCKESCRAKSSL
jgi:hypothetical protein